MEQVGGGNVGLDSTFSLLLPPLPALLPVVRLPISSTCWAQPPRAGEKSHERGRGGKLTQYAPALRTPWNCYSAMTKKSRRLNY